MTRRLLALFLGLALGAVLALGPAAAPAVAAPTCDTYGLGTKLPVLLVHGFRSSGATWDRSVYERGGELPGAPGTFITETFDYADEASEWVQDNPKSGAAKRLAERIQCLAQASSTNGGPGKVALVGHSMGGLLIRCALTTSCSTGPDVVRHTGQVVTVGTPALGSFWRAHAALSQGLALLGRVVQAECAVLDAASRLPSRLAAVALANAWVSQPLCRFIESFTSGSAAKAFTMNSPELAKLPPWPRGVHAHAIAASVDYVYQLVIWEAVSLNVGDLVVGLDSASHGASGGALGGTRTLDCGDIRTTSIPAGALVTAVTSVPNCDHVRETRDERIAEMVGQAIGAWKDAMYRPLSAADLRSAPVPALCNFPAGRLVDGQLPGQPISAGQPPTLTTTSLDGSSTELVALGDLDGDGRGDAAGVVNCNAGGVGWPDNIVFWSASPDGPSVLGAYEMFDAVGDARNGTLRLTMQPDGSVVVDSLDQRPFDTLCCVSGRARVSLEWDGGHVVATDVQHLPGPYDATFAGIGEVRLDMSAEELEALGYRRGDGDYYGCVSYTADEDDLTATYHPGRDAVVKVAAWGGRVVTPHGLQAGSFLDDVRSAYADETVEDHLDGSMGQGFSGLLVGDGSGGWISFLTDDGDFVSDILVSDREHFGAREAGCE